MITEQIVSPDEQVFRAHVASADFQAGVDRGDWRLLNVDWPVAFIAVSAAARPNGPHEFVLRFELSNYPVAEPTAGPWDIERSAPLAAELWPKGERVGVAFNPSWNMQALYIPCDRLAIQGHDGWKTAHRRFIWDSTRDITFYLRLVHELLNDEDYQGV